jgi:hypothetical protein
VVFADVEEVLEIVGGDRRTNGLCLREVRLFTIAEGGFTFRKLAVVGVEGVGASE